MYQVGETWVGFLCSKRQEISRLPFVFTGGIMFVNYNYKKPKESLRNFRFAAPNTLSRRLADSLKNPQLSPALRKILPDLSPMGALFARDVLLETPGDANAKSYISSLIKEDNTNLVTSSLRTARIRYIVSRKNGEHISKVIEGVLKKRKKDLVMLPGFNMQSLKKTKYCTRLEENESSICLTPC